MNRLLRSPNLVAYWHDGQLVVDEYVRRYRVVAAPIIVQVLGLFGRPRTVERASRMLDGFNAASVAFEIRRLARWGLLVPVRGAQAIRDVAAAWNGARAAAHFHFATRDPVYLHKPAEQLAYVRRRFAAAPQPSPYLQYPGRPRVPLPDHPGPGNLSLLDALGRRRTVRTFSRRPVTLADLAQIVHGTWGQTGWLDSGIFGRLLTKTSPSAGARHPIECYVLAWRVEGLAPGVYHFNVQRACLERLHKGDCRAAAVAAAGGQSWVRGAAFLCVMTAVAGRVFWKYASADAYRLFLLDAGHLAQTFVLLATAAGLGPFTTAALSERRIERLLGLDGVREFPVYLCGAGSRRDREASAGAPRFTARSPAGPLPTSSRRRRSRMGRTVRSHAH